MMLFPPAAIIRSRLRAGFREGIAADEVAVF